MDLDLDLCLPGLCFITKRRNVSLSCGLCLGNEATMTDQYLAGGFGGYIWHS